MDFEVKAFYSKIPFRVVIYLLGYLRIRIVCDNSDNIDSSCAQVIFSPFCNLVSYIPRLLNYMGKGEIGEDSLRVFFGYFGEDFTRKVFFLFPAISLDVEFKEFGCLPLRQFRHIDFQRRTRSSYFGFNRELPDPVLLRTHYLKQMIRLESLTGMFILQNDCFDVLGNINKNLKKFTFLCERASRKSIARRVNRLKDLKTLYLCPFDDIIGSDEKNEKNKISLPKLKQIVTVGEYGLNIDFDNMKFLRSVSLFDSNVSKCDIEELLTSKSLEEIVFWKCRVPENLDRIFQSDNIKRICLKECHPSQFDSNRFFGSSNEVLVFENASFLENSFENMLKNQLFLKVLILENCHLTDDHFRGCMNCFSEGLKISLKKNRKVSSSILQELRKIGVEFIPVQTSWSRFFH